MVTICLKNCFCGVLTIVPLFTNHVTNRSTPLLQIRSQTEVLPYYKSGHKQKYSLITNQVTTASIKCNDFKTF